MGLFLAVVKNDLPRAGSGLATILMDKHSSAQESLVARWATPACRPVSCSYLADSFAVMERGEIVLSGSREELVEQDVRRYLTV